MIHRVAISYVDVNDRTVLIQQWLVREGDLVEKGQVICILETSKTTIEVAAETAGYIKGVRAAAGLELPVDSTLCYIADDPEEDIPEEETPAAAVPVAVPAAVPGRGTVSDVVPEHLKGKFTRKAWACVVRNGLSPEIFNRQGFVRERDVLASLSGGIVSGGSPSHLNTAAGLTLSALSEMVRQDSKFRSLDSELKTNFYRLSGGHVGRRATMAQGSQVLCSTLDIGDDVVVGADTHIEAEKVTIETGAKIGRGVFLKAREIYIGSESGIEDQCRIACRGTARIGEKVFIRKGFDAACQSLTIGPETFIARDVIVGRGGSGEPTADMDIGDRVFIGERCLLNAGMPVKIGHNSFIGQFTSIMTHNIGHSYLDGYENAFQPVAVGEDCQIGISCVLYPGAVVENGAVVASNSYVIGRIPAGKMVIGVPAKVLKDARRSLSDEERTGRFFELSGRFRALLEARGIEVREDGKGRFVSLSFEYSHRRYQVTWSLDGRDVRDNEGNRHLVAVVLDGVPDALPEQVTYFDLENNITAGPVNAVSEGVREFLRKAGIKMAPWPWRYHGGIL